MTLLPWRNAILLGDVRERLRDLPDGSVHTVVTSPPYWWLRDYGVAGALGLEPTPEEYVANMVAVFREVRRVLRKDGTLWLNLGDSYAGSRQGWMKDGTVAAGLKQKTNRGTVARLDATVGNGRPNNYISSRQENGIKPKDLVGIPWRVAFALQADGWWLRSDIVWAKPNPMPESVTDRPTRSHEYVFLLTRSQRYFYDQEAIKETAIHEGRIVKATGALSKNGLSPDSANDRRTATGFTNHDTVVTSRNRRTVWEIATEPFPEAHFATFPTALVKPCILAGTSELGCCSRCGASWKRLTDREYVKSPVHGNGSVIGRHYATGQNNFDGAGMPRLNKKTRTVGWRTTCKHEAAVERCVVLDPFMGSGTVALVALRAGRDFVGVELNPQYVAMAEARIAPYRSRLL